MCVQSAVRQILTHIPALPSVCGVSVTKTFYLCEPWVSTYKTGIVTASCDYCGNKVKKEPDGIFGRHHPYLERCSNTSQTTNSIDRCSRRARVQVAAAEWPCRLRQGWISGRSEVPSEGGGSGVGTVLGTS